MLRQRNVKPTVKKAGSEKGLLSSRSSLASSLPDTTSVSEEEDHPGKRGPKWLIAYLASIPTFLWAVIVSFVVAILYVWRDTKRHKRSFAIGVFSVFMVVTFVVLLQNIIQSSSYIFIKAAEMEFGEADVIVLTELSNTSSSQFFVNATLFDEKIKDVDIAVGGAPRWILLSKVWNSNDDSRRSRIMSLIMDTEKEEEIGLGRSFGRRPLGKGECYVSASVLRDLGVPPAMGQRITLNIDLVGMMSETGVIDADQIAALENIGAAGGAAGAPAEPITVNVTGNPGVEEFLATLALPLGISVGEGVVTVNATELAGTVVAGLLAPYNYTIELIVVDGIEAPDGKFPNQLGNVIIVDKEFIEEDFKAILETSLTTVSNPAISGAVDTALGGAFTVADFATFVNTFRMSDYAILYNIMYTNRLSTYVKDREGIEHDMIAFTNNISVAIGTDAPVTFQIPLVLAMTITYFIRLFLDQIFNSTVFVLLMLSVMLIYSLMLSDVEEKTYEYGMLRALGMRKPTLATILVIHSLYFSVIGVSLGLLAANILSLPVMWLVSVFSSTPFIWYLSPIAVLFGVVLGFGMPLVANIFPIRRAMGSNLRDALDRYHSSVHDLSVKFIRLENLGLSPAQTAFAVLLIVCGFVVYYMVPYASINLDLPLFFLILNGILLGMVIGMALIAQALQPTMERIVLFCMLWGPEMKIKALVQKHLSGHRKRNSKTAMMFTIALCFIVFAGAMFELQAAVLEDNIKLGVGSDLLVASFDRNSPLDATNMREALDNEVAKSRKRVEGFTFITTDLDFLPEINRAIRSDGRAATLSQHMSVPVLAYGLEQNFLDVVYSQYFRASEVSTQITGNSQVTPSGEVDVVDSLYRNKGEIRLPIEGNDQYVPDSYLSGIISVNTEPEDGDVEGLAYAGRTLRDAKDVYGNYLDVLCSESLRDWSSVSVQTGLSITVEGSVTKPEYRGSYYYLGKLHAMIAKMPGFFFSSYKPAAFYSPLLMSTESFMSIVKETVQRSNISTLVVPQEPIYSRLLVRLAPGTSKNDREAVINIIRNFVTSDLIFVIDTITLLANARVATDMLILFFNVVGLIAAIMCFFILWVSFSANVRDNSWEFGVLRSLGLSLYQVIRVYVYEALCLMISAIIFGTAIGVIVSVTLTLQFNLFTEMPFVFRFPWLLYFNILAMSLFAALFGSIVASNDLRKKPIAAILKGG